MNQTNYGGQILLVYLKFMLSQSLGPSACNAVFPRALKHVGLQAHRLRRGFYLFVPCGQLLALVCDVCELLSHCYPGSVMVLDCIDS